MGEQHRIAFRRLDRPEVVEFGQEAIGVEPRRAADLTGVVEAVRRAYEADLSARRQIVVLSEFAVFDPQVADQWNQKAGGHGVDKGRTTLERVADPGNGPD
jgi:hypothetical protein